MTHKDPLFPIASRGDAPLFGKPEVYGINRDIDEKIYKAVREVSFQVNDAMNEFILTNVKQRFDNDTDITYEEIIDINIKKITEAIKKQRPIAPQKYIDSTSSRLMCPVCGEKLNYYQKFCGNCGQAIKWRSCDD